MEQKNNGIIHEEIRFTGSHDNVIAGDVYRPSNPVRQQVAILVHGGGQTRHSWGGTARSLAENGWTAIIIDQRGHGESEWHADGDYEFASFAEDLTCISHQVQQRYGVIPVSIGASLGGIASMLAEGESKETVLTAVVLVDITPRMKMEGVIRILGFMSENAESGFASVEEAADAIAAYLPHRPRPENLDGLAKNLRQHDDGRYRWHWDPQFIARRHDQSPEDWQIRENRLIDAARALSVPVLLIRGRQSELVDENEVDEFLKMVPHAEYTDISDAGHMIAGDKNDVFTHAVVTFLQSLER